MGNFVRIGALWNKVSSKTGTPFLAGTVELEGKKYKITVFAAREKKTDKHPDWDIMMDDGNAPQPSAAEAAYDAKNANTLHGKINL